MSEYRVSDGWVPEARRVVYQMPGAKPLAHCYSQQVAERIARALRLLDATEQDEPEPQCEKGVGHWFGPGCDTCQCGQLRERAPWVEPQP